VELTGDNVGKPIDLFTHVHRMTVDKDFLTLKRVHHCGYALIYESCCAIAETYISPDPVVGRTAPLNRYWNQIAG